MSVTVVAGTPFLCPALDATKKFHSLISECLKVFIF